MKFQDVIDAWDKAPLDAIHPTRAVSERAYRRSGEVSAQDLLKVLAKGSVVDFGCGDGRVAVPLRVYGVNVTAVDASPNMIDALLKRDPGMPCFVSDGTDLVERLGHYVDAVICLAVLIHHGYEDGEQIVANLAAAVRPGGLLILHWPTSEHPSERQTWIQVTTWGDEQQQRITEALGLRKLDLGLEWSCFEVA